MIRPHYVPLYSGVSMSEKLAALPDDSCRLFYTWLLSHCDAWGRSKAGAGHLTAKVWPLLGKTRVDTERALEELWAADLIVRYDVDGEAYLAIPDWEEKAGKVGDTKRRGKSLFPAPPDGLSKSSPGIPGVVLPRARAHDPSLIRSDPILSEPERREDKTLLASLGAPAAPPPALPKPRKQATGDQPEAIRHWEAEWARTRLGTAYTIQTKDGVAFAKLLKLKGSSLDEVKTRSTRMLESQDGFFVRAAEPALLLSKWSQFAVEVKPTQDARDPMQSWAAQELARRHADRS